MTDELAKLFEEQRTRVAELMERYSKLLPDSDDVALVIIKGHLIIESVLFNLATEHCAEPRHLAEAKLTFAQLTRVVRSLLKLPMGESCWESIRILNSLRNDLAHKLEPEKVEARIEALYKITKRGSAPYPPNYIDPKQPAEIARLCISYMLGQLEVIQTVSAVVERRPDILRRSTT